jgi:TetR/AcrR family transcriptional repressor of uid operon
MICQYLQSAPTGITPLSAEPTIYAEPARAELRRAQILTAAAHCFRTHGFHAASIAQLAKAAGMSVGHIYHYFENKEAIIAGIVAQDLDRMMTSSAELRSEPDVLAAVLDRVAAHLNDMLEPHSAGLKLEIVVEASRNERVADIVRGADAQGMASLVEVLRRIRRSDGHDDDDDAIVGMAEIIAAMIEGLMVRSLRNPALDRDRAIGLVRRIIVFLAKA